MEWLALIAEERRSVLGNGATKLLSKFFMIGEEVHIHVNVEVDVGLRARLRNALLARDVDDRLSKSFGVAGFEVAGRALVCQIGHEKLGAMNRTGF